MTDKSMIPETNLTKAMVLLFAVTGGLAVGNLYWAQPLLHVIAIDMHIPAGNASLLITITQLGYALGIFLIVPLGDTINRKYLIPAVLFTSALALLGCALSSQFIILCIFMGILGVTTVGGGILTPFISDISPAAKRGKIIGTIVSGMLTGILLSRTLSGFSSEYLGWRSIYFFAAGCTFLLAMLLLFILPEEKDKARIPYVPLILSVFKIAGSHKAIRTTLMLGFGVFAVFSAFWTGLTFLLSSSPFFYTTDQIGLVGIAGLAGALAARRAGSLHDKGYSVAATGYALILAIVSLAVTLIAVHTIWLVIIAVITFDMAIQTLNVVNQSRILALDPVNRSRINTAFITLNFIGGATGSALTGLLWNAGNWYAVAGAGMAVLGITFLIWFFFRGNLATHR
ncbi:MULTISPECIES: MFS transporter [Enterobacteriaceae]|nr:MFS transporter [Klebsiella quasipneumoniae]ELZ3956670.1 MFS transporter [Cronobacter sakazakii]HCB5608007.1 MFS transporter [Klebsiella aerogenes]HCD3251988.1 MFS transporter [Klebsiella pneumoniae]MDD9617275.1 MFS transporter [Klebsiella quasipneumoniae]MDD9622473.1 MFS transporter [Klebsiella quasipneumoniae]